MVLLTLLKAMILSAAISSYVAYLKVVEFQQEFEAMEQQMEQEDGAAEDHEHDE